MPRDKHLFVKDALLVSLSPPRVVEGHLRIEEGKIVEAGPRIGIRSGDAVVDRWGKPVLPGFVLAPFVLAGSLDGSARRPLEKREIAPRATLALLEALSCGVTAVRLVPPPLQPEQGALEEFDRAFRAAGIRGVVVTGSADGGQDASSPDPTERMRLAAARSQGVHAWDPIRALAEGYGWVRERFGLTLGTVETGAPADLVFLDYVPAEPIREENLAGHLLAISSRHVEGVMVAGKALYRRREPVFPVDRDECVALLAREPEKAAPPTRPA
jgi:cytosine/adenosine deaminase-related metal-dependent hydrolase